VSRAWAGQNGRLVKRLRIDEAGACVSALPHEAVHSRGIGRHRPLPIVHDDLAASEHELNLEQVVNVGQGIAI
jgi:hypothetical protein